MTQPLQMPFSIDAEKAFLSSLFLRAGLVEQCESLNPQIFYIPAHRIIFQMLIDLWNSNSPQDFVTCKMWLRDHKQLEEVGGVEGLNEIWSFIPTSEAWAHYLGILKDNHIRRQTISSCHQLAQTMYDPAIDSNSSIQSVAESALSQLVVNLRKMAKEFPEIVTDTMSHICNDEPDMSGVRFDIATLDTSLSGVKPGEYLVICAEVSAGKTALAIQAALTSAYANKRVAIFSFEMPAIQLVTRMISQRALIRMQSIRSKRFSQEELTRLRNLKEPLSKLPMHLDDSFDTSINGLVNRCRQIHAKNKLDLVVVDYIQLVTPGVEKRDLNREREVADISRKLKKLSGELDLSVIALSQLNETGKMRESRSISQDADIILRIEIPDPKKDTFREILIDKQRNGPRGQRVPVQFFGQYVTFEDCPQTVS